MVPQACLLEGWGDLDILHFVVSNTASLKSCSLWSKNFIEDHKAMIIICEVCYQEGEMGNGNEIRKGGAEGLGV